MPRMFYISKIDEENSDYYTSLHKLQKQFGVSVAPVVVPIFEGNRDTVGIVDCVIRKAYRMDGNKRVEIPIPEDMKDRIDQHRAALCENIAELSEDLMERYFAGEEFSDEELIAGIRQGVRIWSSRRYSAARLRPASAPTRCSRASRTTCRPRTRSR